MLPAGALEVSGDIAEREDDGRRLELEKKLSAELLRLSRINRDLKRDRILRDRTRLLKERSDINMLLLLYEAQQREAESGGVGAHEIQELLRAQSGGELDDREIMRLRARRQEIGNMLREVERLGEDHRELGQDRVIELTRERDQLKERVVGMLQDPVYFDHRVRKIQKQLGAGKRDKVVRYLRGLEEQLGPSMPVDCFSLLARLYADDEELRLEDVVGLAQRSASGSFLQALLAEHPLLSRRFPEGWRSVVAAALRNVALFRGVPFEARSDFWQSQELRQELHWQWLSAQNPSSPPQILSLLLHCPAEELERCRVAARARYGSDSALHTMTEVLRASRDPEIVGRMLDIVDHDPIVRYRFYHVAMHHSGLPAPLAARILSFRDASLEEYMDFRRRNPEVGTR